MYNVNNCGIGDDVFVHLGNRKNGNKSNVGYIISDRIYIYDTSYSPAFFEKMLHFLVQYDKDIVIILSHHHSDHINGIRYQLDEVKIDIICTESTAVELGNTVLNVKICRDFIQLNENIFVKRIENCHTKEDLVLIDYKNKVLFMGDILLDGHHPLLYNESLKQWVYYLNEFYKMKFTYYVPGHGIGMKRNIVKGYIYYLELLEKLCDEQEEPINRKKIKTFLEKTYSIDWLHIENLYENLGIEVKDQYNELGEKI